MAGRKNHSPKDIVRLLQRYDGMSVDDAKERRELRPENVKLKCIVSYSELEKLMLKEIAKGKCSP
jgi:hypothetical protein